MRHMMGNVKKYLIFIFIIFFLSPIITFAQTEQKKDEVFQAKVIEITDQRESIIGDDSVIQQNIKLKGLEGDYKNKEVEFIGVGGYSPIKNNVYKVGDKVLAVASSDDQGNITFYITDYVRTNSILWLLVFFVIATLIVGGWKGFRSILSLVVTFLIIIKFLIPQILAGANPVFISLIGGIIIFLVIVYLTEGINKLSNLAILTTLISLIITIALSYIFVNLAKLSGLNSEETAYLVNIGNFTVNFKGLLLAGIIIGTIGVLDDVIISQIATVEQLHKTDSYLNRKELFKKAYHVGVIHISSMVNTLFLAYVGASLPLLILFISGQSAFSSYGQIVNNEQIATEIVRTVSGSIGLVLSVPISTIIAVWGIKKS